jgi:hypothetical protein
MVQFKDFGRAFCVVGIKMGKRNNIDFFVVTEATAELFLQIATLVFRFRWIAHIREVEQGPAAVLKFNQAAVGIAGWEEADGMHFVPLYWSWQPRIVSLGCLEHSRNMASFPAVVTRFALLSRG